MSLIILAFSYLYYILPVVIVVLIVAALLRSRHKTNNRDSILNEFESVDFSGEDELAWYIAHDIMGKSGFSDCVIYKVDANEKLCRQVAAYGPKNPEKTSILNPINIPFGRGIVGSAAATGLAAKIDDTTKDPRYVPDDDVRYSELTVPVIVNSQVYFVIDSEDRKIGYYSDADLVFVTRVAAIAATKLISK